MKAKTWFTVLCGIAAAFLAAAAPTATAENVWVSHGPTGAASINDIAIADSIAYAATPNGVFRSLDRGATWQRSGLAGQAIAQVVARSGGPVVLAHGFSTLYASRDHGESWTPLSGPPYVSAIGINPHRPATIWVAADRIWKSTDAGLTWLTLHLPGGSTVEFAFDSRLTYVWKYDLLLKSFDGGVSWLAAHPPLESIHTVETGAVDGVVYAAGPLGGEGRFCRSADSAATWTCSATPSASFGRSSRSRARLRPARACWYSPGRERFRATMEARRGRPWAGASRAT